MKPQHTPTPWHLSFDSGTAIYGKTKEGSELVGHFVSPANAAYIVKCVNLHETLCEDLTVILHTLGDQMQTSFRIKVKRDLEEALSKAKGE
jgi:hypothetical protein